MKLKSKILTVLGVAATSTGVVTPLVLTTGCSCGKNSNNDYGVDVTEGYVADEKYLIEKGQDVHLYEGADKWFNYVKDHTDAPAEEAKWAAGYLATKSIPAMAYSSDELEIKTKVYEVRADLKNFKVDDAAKHRASYDISGYYDYEVYYDIKKPIQEVLKVDPIKIHIQLGFHSSVKNAVLKVEDCSKLAAIGTEISLNLDPSFRSAMSRMGYDVWSIMPDLDYITGAIEDKDYSIYVKTEGSMTTFDKDDKQLGVYGLDYERTINQEFMGYLENLIIMSSSTIQVALAAVTIFELIMSLCGWRSWVLSESNMIKRYVVDTSKPTWEEVGEGMFVTDISFTFDEKYTEIDPLLQPMVWGMYNFKTNDTTPGGIPENYQANIDGDGKKIHIIANMAATKKASDIPDIQLYFFGLKDGFNPYWVEGFNIPNK